MKKLREFVRAVCRQTHANCFIDVTYYAGPEPEVSDMGDIFIAHIRLQVLLNGAVSNILFYYKHERDYRDERGSVYGRGRTADRAFAALLRSIAGKTLEVTVGDTIRTIDVPRDITEGKLST